ncbi:MAG: L-histidine N(alpha)-methyltransferase, partial [Vicinamibacteria bacterium]
KTATTTDPVARFAEDVADSLQRTPRQVPAMYLYDALGSALFEAICQLPWYRITRAEQALLDAHAPAILAAAGMPGRIVELGPGSGEKLARLTTAAARDEAPVDVHLVDISEAALDLARRTLSRAGAARISLHHGTYEDGLRGALAGRTEAPVLVAFLGSNLGNFDPAEARALLAAVRRGLRPGDGLLLGLDLVKPEAVLQLAYDDPLSVTAAFNLNVLRRMNDELGADFDLAGFKHRAVWNARESRVEMHLVSLRRQRVRVREAGLDLTLDAGESIWTESSHKFTPAAAGEIGAAAGFAAGRQWTDEEAGFALTLFTVDEQGSGAVR